MIAPRLQAIRDRSTVLSRTGTCLYRIQGVLAATRNLAALSSPACVLGFTLTPMLRVCRATAGVSQEVGAAVMRYVKCVAGATPQCRQVRTALLLTQPTRNLMRY